MKKFLAILLAAFMLFGLVACGGGETAKTEEPAPAEEQPAEEAPAEEPAEEAPAEEPAEEEPAEEPAEEEPAEEPAEEEPAEEEPAEEVEIVTDRNKEQIIYGSGTEISGDWAHGAYWTNNATDNMIRGLMNDYSTVVTNQFGEYIINPTIAESIDAEENEDGSKTFTVKIAEDLVFNDGSPITAENFVAALMLFAHPTLKELGSKSSAALTYVGGPEYQSGEKEEFAGVHLIDDYTYSLTVVPEKVPYFYELTYAGLTPLSIDMWLGEGYGVKDDGEGCYFEGDMSVEALKDRIEEVRFLSEGRITAGPYNLISYDVGSKQAVLEINENYKGNFEGVKPSIKRIIVAKAEDATQFDALATGQLDMISELTGGEDINKALDMVEAGGFETIDYDRAGYGKLMFQCDFGPTQFEAVRHAIAYLLDRQEFANKFTSGFGAVVHGPYGIAQWQYQEAEETLDEELNEYPFSVDEAIAVLEEDGWVLNAEGGEYTEGVRYKEVTKEEAGDYEHNIEVDGKILMPLIIEWSSTENNPVSELLATMLANDTAPKAGMEIRQAVMTFEELLNWMYRDKSVGEQYGVPKYGMFNLATNFNPDYDMSYSFTLDPDMVADGWNVNYIFDEELDKLSMDMVYGVDSTERDKYLDLWTQFIIRWNELLPEIPLYSNIYYTIFRDDLVDYEANPFWSFEQAIVYASIEQ